MRTTVSIQEPLLDHAKQAAAERGVSVSEVIEDALRGYFASRPAPKSKVFRLPTVRGKLLQPNLDLDRTSELVIAEDVATYGRKRS